MNILWENYNLKVQDDDIRKEFKGTPMINPVTGRVEPMFTSAQRFRKYIESFFICLPFFIVILFVMICFLNLTGVIDPYKHNAFLHIDVLAHLCAKGAIFDPNGSMAAVISIVQVVATMIMNKIFRRVAIFTTERENHRTQTGF